MAVLTQDLNVEWDSLIGTGNVATDGTISITSRANPIPAAPNGTGGLASGDTALAPFDRPEIVLKDNAGTVLHTSFLDIYTDSTHGKLLAGPASVQNGRKIYRRLLADFYWPQGATNCPGCGHSHGGGNFTGSRTWNTGCAAWAAGNPLQAGTCPECPASAGFVVMNTDYCLSPPDGGNSGDHMKVFSDHVNALAFFASYMASAHPGVLDATRIGWFGTSEGGLMTSLLSTTDRGDGQPYILAGVTWSIGINGNSDSDLNDILAPLLFCVSSGDNPSYVSGIHNLHTLYSNGIAPDGDTDLIEVSGTQHALTFFSNKDCRILTPTMDWLNQKIAGADIAPPGDTDWVSPTTNLSGGWSNPANAFAQDGVYATASPARNAVKQTDFGDFNLGNFIPSDALIDSVQLKVRYKVSTTASIAAMRLNALVAGVAQALHQDTAEPTADTDYIVDITGDRAWARADLIGSNFGVRAGAGRGDSATAVTHSMDVLQVRVTWHQISTVTAVATSVLPALTQELTIDEILHGSAASILPGFVSSIQARTHNWRNPTSDNGSGWTNRANMYAEDATYATATPSSGANIATRYGNFGMENEVPATAVPISIHARVKYAVSTTASQASLTVRARVGGVAQGSHTDSSEPTSYTFFDADLSADRAWTYADIVNGTLEIEVIATRAVDPTTVNFSADVVQVRVVWDYPATRVATILSTLPALTQGMVVVETVEAAAASVLPALTQIGSTEVLVDGIIASSLPALTQGAVSHSTLHGTAASVLPALQQEFSVDIQIIADTARENAGVSMLNLSSEQRDIYLDCLNFGQMTDIEIHQYDRDEVYKGQLPPADYYLLGGQIDVDASDDSNITRQLQLSLALRNPGSFSSVVADGPMHPARYLEVVMRTYCPNLGYWVTTSVFYGLPSKVEFDELDQLLSITAVSKESLLLPPNVAKNKSESALIDISKETTFRLDDFIKRVAKQHGETKFRLAKCKSDEKVDVVPSKYDAYTKERGVWPYLKRAAHNWGYQLYYDREGYLVLAHTIKTNEDSFQSEPTAGWTFTDSDVNVGGKLYKSNVFTMPKLAWDGDLWRNRCSVFGATKSNKKTHLITSWFYDQSDVFGSTTDLQRNGVRRDMTEIIEHDGIISVDKANNIAQNTLKRLQYIAQEAEFECIPVAHMELETVQRLLSVDSPATYFIPQKWTLPLTPGELMSVGFNKRVPTEDKRRRFRH